MEVRQFAAAIARCDPVNVVCMSFSASANVAAETSGPTGGLVLNADGVPGGGLVSWASAKGAAALASSTAEDL